MAKQDIVLPELSAPVIPPAVLSQLDPDIRKYQIRLLELQIGREEEELRKREEAKAKVEAEKQSRFKAAQDARVVIEKRLAFQQVCGHRKSDGKTALGGMELLADPVTHKEKAYVMCSVCEMIDEAPLAELRERYGNLMPSRSLMGKVSTDTDY